MLAATWAAAIVAGVVGLLGLIIGVIGLVQANKARGTAAAANLTAKGAVSVARQANTFAEEANEIAREANSIATGQAEKAGELHRIDWDFRWTDLGVYQVANLGPDAATNLHAQITVAHETKTGEVDRLEVGEAFELFFPKAKARWRNSPHAKGAPTGWAFQP
jgi:hypothetical protein